MTTETKTTQVIDPTFKIPDTSVAEPENAITQNIAFEKYKIRMNFCKWLMGTFCIAIITITINWSFNDRAVGMNELSAYEKYTTEVMVLNENPVKKRMLAQFFGTAAPSYFIRNRWKDYYKEVDKEYKEYLDTNKTLRKKYRELVNKSEPTNWDKIEMEYIKDKLDLYKIQEASTVIIPQNTTLTGTNNVTSNNKTLAIAYEKEGFRALLDQDYEKAVKNFQNSYQLYPNLHNVSEIHKLLLNKKPVTPQDWNEKYSFILKELSWGMPQEARNEMQRILKK